MKKVLGEKKPLKSASTHHTILFSKAIKECIKTWLNSENLSLKALVVTFLFDTQCQYWKTKEISAFTKFLNWRKKKLWN